MNISDQSAVRNCTSCSMCSAVCPVDAISINLDRQGFYRPIINDKCIDCGQCTKVCYKFDDNIYMTNNSQLDNYDLYGAYAKDSIILKHSTSGGIADILAKSLVADGYSCIGVKYDNETNTAKTCIAHTIEETDGFRGSKYIQSYTESAFKQLVHSFKSNRDNKFAVFGLPCQIYAINRYLTIRGLRDRCVLVDLYCHGCPSLNAWKKYLKYILPSTVGTKVSYAIFRSKLSGWGSGYFVEVGLDGFSTPIVGKITNDPFFELFFSNSILNSSCADCLLRSTLEYTDIRLGDFWGKVYLDNHTGVSAVTVISPRGKQLLDNIKDQIVITQRKFIEFLPYQSWHRTYIVNETIRKETLYVLSRDDKSIKDAIAVLRQNDTINQQIKRIAKNILRRYPNVVRRLKKFM